MVMKGAKKAVLWTLSSLTTYNYMYVNMKIQYTYVVAGESESKHNTLRLGV